MLAVEEAVAVESEAMMILLEASRIVRRSGWVQHTMVSKTGRVCAAAAIVQAVDTTGRELPPPIPGLPMPGEAGYQWRVQTLLRRALKHGPLQRSGWQAVLAAALARFEAWLELNGRLVGAPRRTCMRRWRGGTTSPTGPAAKSRRCCIWLRWRAGNRRPPPAGQHQPFKPGEEAHQRAPVSRRRGHNGRFHGKLPSAGGAAMTVSKLPDTRAPCGSCGRLTDRRYCGVCAWDRVLRWIENQRPRPTGKW